MNNHYTHFSRILLGIVVLLLVVSLPAEFDHWANPRNLSQTSTNSLDPAIAISRDGKIHVVWTDWDQPPLLFKSRIYYAQFNGSFWTDALVITPAEGTTNWNPHIALDNEGHPHVVWERSDEGEIYYRYYNGTNWSVEHNISESSGSSYNPKINIDQKNLKHIVWNDNSPGSPSIFYCYIDGTYRSPAAMISDTLAYSQAPVLAIDEDDFIHCAWISAPSSKQKLRIHYRSRKLENWSPIERISADTLEAKDPALALKSDGSAVLVWRQILADGQNEQIYFREQSTGLWADPEAVCAPGQFLKPDIVTDDQDQIYVVWNNRSSSSASSQLHLSRYVRREWTGPFVLLEHLAYDCLKPKIALDSHQQVHLVWQYMQPTSQPTGEIYYVFQDVLNAIKPDSDEPPRALQLAQNYPNPFNGQTTIEFELQQAGQYRLEISDLNGKRVETLSDAFWPAGRHRLQLDGSHLASGVYMYSLRGQNFVVTKKMILLR